LTCGFKVNLARFKNASGNKLKGQKPVIEAIIAGLKSDVGKYSLPVTFVRALRRGRIFPQINALHQLRSSNAFQLHLESLHEADTLACLSHRHYLARSLTPGQRAKAACCHYSHEDRQFDAAYLAQVYCGDGLRLWQQIADDIHYEIRLMPGNDVLYEGAQSIVLFANGGRICVMSFTLIPVETALPDNHTPGEAIYFITRKQLTQTRDYQAPFNKTFHRATPAHLCFSAFAGFAIAQGFDRAIGISPRQHPSCTAQNRIQFETAYSEFWVSVSGQPISPLGFLIALPPLLPSLEMLDASKRKRAKQRRIHGEEVLQAARDVIKNHLRAAVPG
jgi:uncharacterized protein VirK/YbjX